jgi:hypothetical protein
MIYPARAASLVLFALIAWQRASPQSVTLQPPTLGDAERAYRDAQSEWLNADPKLAADLFRGNPQEMHRRIRQTASLRDQMMEKKSVYLDLVVKHFDETRARLVNLSGAQLPVPELRQNLEAEQSRILGEIDRLDALIRDLPQDDLYALVLHELNAERTQLVNLQVSLAQQIRSVNSMGDSQDAANKMQAANPLAGKLEAISKVWRDELEAARVQREHWKALYNAMEQAVDRGKNSTSPASPGTTANPAGGSATKPRIVAPAPRAQDWNRQTGFDGMEVPLPRRAL